MAKLAGFPGETFAAMQNIRETSLVRFDSLFTPDRQLWSLQNHRRFHALFVERFDEGEGTFLEKFRKQLEGARIRLRLAEALESKKALGEESADQKKASKPSSQKGGGGVFHHLPG